MGDERKAFGEDEIKKAAEKLGIKPEDLGKDLTHIPNKKVVTGSDVHPEKPGGGKGSHKKNSDQEAT